jgi:hypothetical protein
MTSVPFLFLSFETNILTTLSIIDIWESTFRKKKNKSLNLQREGGDNKGTPVFERILFKIEGGDYEGVQSFSKRG